MSSPPAPPVLSAPTLHLQQYRVLGAPPSAFYIPDFITTDEETLILSKIYSAPIPKWTQLSNRRLQNWGGIPHSKGMIAETIPMWLQTHLDKIHELNVMSSKKPNHVLVNEYLSGQGIMPHLDGSLFYPTITTISLGSHTVLKFLKESDNSEVKALTHVCSLLLEPRSLLILQDDLFFKYLHSIEEIKEDNLDRSLVNLNLCKRQCKSTLERATRVSLTIRHVPKTSVFKINTIKG